MVLKKLKKKMNKMRPEELAAQTGLSFNTVVKAMKGQDISNGSAEIIAKAFGVHSEDLA